jgi:hypothetical protein
MITQFCDWILAEALLPVPIVYTTPDRVSKIANLSIAIHLLIFEIFNTQLKLPKA